MANKFMHSLWKRVMRFIVSISIEPVFFLDGFAFSIMIVLVESLQFDKICKVNLGYNQTICDNFDSYPQEKLQYDLQVGAFKRNEGIITSVIPFFFILFIGAWSDKYGRKFPLCLTLFAHILFSGGYLINSIFVNIQVDYLYIVGFLDSIGGGAVAFLTVSNAYISDVTTEEERTSKVALANSLWFLGGPLGTLIGTQIFKNVGYVAVFSTSLGLYLIAIVYVGVFLPESYGPFANKERLKQITERKPSIRLRETIIRVYGISKKKRNNFGQTLSQEERVKSTLTYKKMCKDFFDIKRVILSFKCVFRKRDGYIRFFIFLLILSNFLRKIGRGAYAFYFTKEVLKWDAEYYGYWVTYKNLVATLGSLFVLPVLCTRLNVPDNILAIVGSISSVLDYFLYGLVNSSTSFLMWLAPAAALLINSCSIAMRAMMSKFVKSDELGQVSSVTGTMEGIVPVVSTSLYSAITSATFETFPGAQYFFGSACNVIMLLIFILIIITDKGGKYDIESAKPPHEKTTVKERTIVLKNDSNWVNEENRPHKMRLVTIMLTALNFGIQVPTIDKRHSKKRRENKRLAKIIQVLDNPQSDTLSSPTTHQMSNGITHSSNNMESQAEIEISKERKHEESTETYTNEAFIED